MTSESSIFDRRKYQCRMCPACCVLSFNSTKANERQATISHPCTLNLQFVEIWELVE